MIFINKHLKKTRGHISRNVVEITIKMKTIVQKLLMIKKSTVFVYTQLNVKTVLFQITEFSLCTQFSSI